MELSKGGSVFGATLLIAGTAIGAGMLALPVLTASAGFLPAFVIFLLCWIFMACTGLLLMEVFLWSKKETNIVSMATMTLGPFGTVFAWVLYLFLFYSVTVAYVAGGGDLATNLFEALGKIDLPDWIGPIVFVLIFAPFVAIGAKAVDRLNWILMAGLIVSFLFFFFLGIGTIEFSLLARMKWWPAILALPVVFLSFGYQGIVPTITNYLDRNPQRVKKAIIFGTAIPFVVYVLWEALILGVIPEAALNEARAAGQSAVEPLKDILRFPWLYPVGEFFAFFAIVTSFLGVALGLLDFLADGLKIKKTVSGRLLLSAMIFIPPLLFAVLIPHIFLIALQYAGGLGSALLLGLLPVLMVWAGRYHLKFKSEYRLGGGRVVLILLILFIIIELAVLFFG